MTSHQAKFIIECLRAGIASGPVSELFSYWQGRLVSAFQDHLASMTHPRRLMRLAELADVAAFMASDRASGMTGTTVNLTMGSLDD